MQGLTIGDEWPPFFQVTVRKFVILTTLTAGLYVVPWLYFHWEMIRIRTGDRINPVRRSVVYGALFLFPLFREVQRETAKRGATGLQMPDAFAALFLLLSTFNFLPVKGLSLFGLLTVVPLAIVQSRVNRLHAKLGFDSRANGRFSALNVVCSVFGSLVLAITLWGALYA